MYIIAGIPKEKVNLTIKMSLSKSHNKNILFSSFHLIHIVVWCTQDEEKDLLNDTELIMRDTLVLVNLIKG